MSVKSRVEKIEKNLRKEARAGRKANAVYINTVADYIVWADADEKDPCYYGKEIIIDPRIKKLIFPENEEEGEKENGEAMQTR